MRGDRLLNPGSDRVRKVARRYWYRCQTASQITLRLSDKEDQGGDQAWGGHH